ncbi:sulfite exporter TauE/SafE family protein [Thalassomonas actiniarum]|uniref:Probable membrane transporter protein n=1 Tax=Thalassomonas actiniarum TaxID=485447 RepID=A0AAE9YME5_9GAMM|nr:TSUP family transporter [Thalassomonas actiniarum]WDD97591.1 TSUP family transporter [Thalassomonas actiniarum]
MDPVLDLTMWLLICGVGFVAGFIDAIAGGGGMLTVPTLLTAGLPPHIALGTNKLASTFGTCTASLTFYRKKLFDPLFWRVSLLTTAIGAVAGTVIVGFLSTEFLEKILPVIIILTAAYTLFAKTMVECPDKLPQKSKKLTAKQGIQGLTLGFYDGIAGPGTGAFWTVSSSALYRINILLSSGLARANNFVSNLCSLLTFVYLGYVNVLLGLMMGLFLMLGAWVGAHSAIKHGNKFIRPIFITVVILMSINLAYNAWFS